MDFLKSKTNPNMLKALYIIGFAISGFFTAKCLTTLATDKVTWVAFVGMTIVFEFGKGMTFFESLNTRHSKKIRNRFKTIWIFLVALSLFASIGLAINESNKTVNDKIKGSKAWQLQSDQHNIEKQNLKNLQEELNTLNKTNIDNVIAKDGTIKGYKQNAASARRNNVITNPESGANHFEELAAKREQELRNNYTNRKQELPDLINKQTEKVNKAKNDLGNVTTDGLKDTNGYRGTLKIVTDIFNQVGLYYFSKWTVDQMELVFYFIISLMLEFLICLMYYLKKFYEIGSFDVKGVDNDTTDSTSKNIQQDNQQKQVNLSKPEKKNSITALSHNSINLKESNSNVEQKRKIGFNTINNLVSGVTESKENVTPDTTQKEDKKQVGFSYLSKDLKGIQEWHIKFLKELYNKDNWTPRYGATGASKIGKIIGIDRNKSTKFRGTLETLGILRSEKLPVGNKNILLVSDLRTALQIVSKSLTK